MKIRSLNGCPVCGGRCWLSYELGEGELNVVDPDSELFTPVFALDFAAVIDLYDQDGVDECLKCGIVISTFMKE